MSMLKVKKPSAPQVLCDRIVFLCKRLPKEIARRTGMASSDIDAIRGFVMLLDKETRK